ncbi:MAG: hypothetical protein NUV96_01825 [Candidatus Colwellbacteria bacterium]|nr:hypothetical protein [Candidatus Colwellbacteria bacterium]
MDQINPEQFRSQLEGIHAEVRQRIESTPEENRDADLHRQAIHEVVGEKLGKTSGGGSVSSKVDDLDPAIGEQVNLLVEEATTKDLDGAINKARKSNDPVIIDAFHDALVGKLFDQLVSDGKLKNLAK